MGNVALHGQRLGIVGSAVVAPVVKRVGKSGADVAGVFTGGHIAGAADTREIAAVRNRLWLNRDDDVRVPEVDAAQRAQAAAVSIYGRARGLEEVVAVGPAGESGRTYVFGKGVMWDGDTLGRSLYLRVDSSWAEEQPAGGTKHTDIATLMERDDGIATGLRIALGFTLSPGDRARIQAFKVYAENGRVTPDQNVLVVMTSDQGKRSVYDVSARGLREAVFVSRSMPRIPEFADLDLYIVEGLGMVAIRGNGIIDFLTEEENPVYPVPLVLHDPDITAGPVICPRPPVG